MGKELKTNAMRFLDKNKIEYTVQTYECEEFIDGIHTAEKLVSHLMRPSRPSWLTAKAATITAFFSPWHWSLT